MQEKEIWRDVKDFKGYYQVSNLGRVISLRKNLVLKRTPNNNGYCCVDLKANGKRKNSKISKLVAIAFIDENYIEKGLVADHIDNNRQNDNLNNIQVITPRENTSKDKKNKTSKYVGVFKRRNKYISSIRINGRKVYLGTYSTEKEAYNVYLEKLKTI